MPGAIMKAEGHRNQVLARLDRQAHLLGLAGHRLRIERESEEARDSPTLSLAVLQLKASPPWHCSVSGAGSQGNRIRPS